MKKHLIPLAFFTFALSSALFYRECTQLHSKGKTELKKASEQFFLEFERKTAHLEAEANKSHLGQLTKQGSKWPILVDYIDDSWKILQPSHNRGLDMNYFCGELKNTLEPTWIRMQTSASGDPIYYRAIPLKEGGIRVLEIKDFEKIFFSSSPNLSFNFITKGNKTVSYPFFPPLETSEPEKMRLTPYGYEIEIQKELAGISPPLNIKMVLPPPLPLCLLALSSLIAFFCFLTASYKVAKQKNQRLLFFSWIFCMLLTVALFQLKQAQDKTHYAQELTHRHATSIAISGVENYIRHIEQLGKILHIVSEQEKMETLDTHFFQKWPYLEKIRFINHSKNEIFEKCSPYHDKQANLNILFLKSSGWIGPENGKTNPYILHYTTVDEKTLILQINLGPLLTPLHILEEKVNAHYNFTKKSLPTNYETYPIEGTPFILEKVPSAMHSNFATLFFLVLSFGGFLFLSWNFYAPASRHLHLTSKVW
ncbi:MAG: hypothetical protein ACOYK9_00490 [Chlamydiia bacterium]